ELFKAVDYGDGSDERFLRRLLGVSWRARQGARQFTGWRRAVPAGLRRGISVIVLAAVAVRGGGRLRQGLGQGGEVGDHPVHGGERENPQDGGAGNDQQHLAALGFGS